MGTEYRHIATHWRQYRADTATLKGLNINYDGLITYVQLSTGSDLTKYEAKVEVTGDTVGVTTASDQDKILITMTTNA